MQTLKAVQDRFKHMRVTESVTSDALTNILGQLKQNGDNIKPLISDYLESISVEPTKVDTLVNELELVYSERLDNANQVPNGDILGHTASYRAKADLAVRKFVFPPTMPTNQAMQLLKIGGVGQRILEGVIHEYKRLGDNCWSCKVNGKTDYMYYNQTEGKFQTL